MSDNFITTLEYVAQAFPPNPSLTEHLVCQGGKLQYVARGGFIQVVNEVTKSLPDFSMSTQTANIIVNTYAGMNNLTTHSFRKQAGYGVIKLVAGLVETEIPVSLTISKDYYGLDETILTPLLESTQSMTFHTEVWHGFFQNAANFTKYNPSALVDVEIDDTVVVAVYEQGACCRTVIPLGDYGINSKFSGRFMLNPLRWNLGEGFLVKISLADKMVPLLMECENGVTVVVSRVYV